MGRLALRLKRLVSGKKTRDILPAHVTVGRGTYGVHRYTVLGRSADAPVTIGNFCSFGPDVLIFAKVDHRIDLPSTYPLRTLLFQPNGPNRDVITKGPVTVGHDVWVGTRAMIASGVTIGHGAVIAAGAVVTRDVPPYAVSAGCPSRVVKYRFPAEQVAALLDIAWWDWPDDKLKAFEDHFYGPVDEFIEAATRAAPGALP